MSILKHGLAAFVLMCLCVCASAEILYFEDFESFNVGLTLHEQAGWEGWYGNAASAATVSGQKAYSGTKSVAIKGSTDAARVFDITEGKWVLTAQQYIPSGTSGVTRFHMQNTYRNGDIGRSVQWSFSLSEGVIGDDYDASASASIVYNEWIELKLIIDLDNDLLEQYYNGNLISAREWVNSGTSQLQSINLFGNSASPVYYDDIQIQDYLSSLVTAHDPSPAHEMVDVLRDATLSWTAGIFANTHDVYFGTEYDTVLGATAEAPLDVLVSQGQIEAAYTPGALLDYGQTYYWRADEVNMAADPALYTGDVWRFEVEPYSIQIPGVDIVTTASSFSNSFSVPDKSVDGSGLGEDDTHDVKTETMWFTTMGDMAPWIQYEFDAVKKLDTMRVWNSNSSAEGFLGYGVKGVIIEYSKDGETWDTFEDVNQFSQAPGLATYDQYDDISLGNIAAKMVRLNIQSNWGGFMQAYSLSEVQFYMIPASARMPVPASGSRDALPTEVASWRAGRDAAQSIVYLSQDPNEVAAGLAPSVTSTTHSLDLSIFDLQMGQTYYWRVDEVNDAETDPVWAGPVWSFTVANSVAVDDFDSYTNDTPNRPFQTWLDGFGYSASSFFPTGYNGNGTGAACGHDIWSASSVHYNGQIMETTILLPDSSQSLPFYYDNTGSTQNINGTTNTARYSELILNLDQDWTVGGAQALSIAFSGSVDNTGTLYVKINDTKITLPDTANLTSDLWQIWTLDLAAAEVQNVTQFVIGVEGQTATGMILIDDIKLHPEVGDLITVVDPDDGE